MEDFVFSTLNNSTFLLVYCPTFLLFSIIYNKTINTYERIRKLTAENMSKEVKIALIRRGWTQGDLAMSIGVSQAYVSIVMKNHRNVPWLWEAIQEKLGLKFEGEAS